MCAVASRARAQVVQASESGSGSAVEPSPPPPPSPSAPPPFPPSPPPAPPPHIPPPGIPEEPPQDLVRAFREEYLPIIVMGLVGFLFLMPIVFVFCGGDYLRAKCCTPSESRAEAIHKRDDKRRRNQAPIYGSSV